MFKIFTHYCRSIHIIAVILHYKLDTLIVPRYLFAPLRWGLRLNPFYWSLPAADTNGQRLRLALETLGPIFVKFGQILSTRHDLLPTDVIAELVKLQDQVKPFSGEVARALIEKAYNRPIESMLLTFDETPIASASIAQVHRATLYDNSRVVVKVLRPHVKRIIRRDLDLLYALARWMERLWPGCHRLHPKAIVAEFERCLSEEIDLLHEAANAAQLKRQCKNSPLLYVPHIHWDYAHKHVLIMEEISGVPIADIATLKAKKVNLPHLAKTLVEIFFTHALQYGYFHADMHPGNLFVNIDNPTRPHCIAVDFGIMGSLNPTDQRYLAENLLAFFKRDYREVAVLHVESGWVPADTRIDEFESAIRAVCEPILAQPLRNISFGVMLAQLLQTARRFNMEVLPQLLLLQKTVLNVEALARSLDPELDILASVKPFIKKWMKEKMGWRGAARKIKHNLPFWLEKFPEVPLLIHGALRQIQQGGGITTPPATVKSKAVTKKRLARSKRQGFLLGVGLSLIVGAGASLIYRVVG